MRRYIRRARTNLCYQTTFTSTSQTQLGRWPLSASRMPSSAAITLQLTVTGQPTEHWNIHQSKYLHLRRLKGPCSQPRQLTDETEIRKVKNRKLDGDNLKRNISLNNKIPVFGEIKSIESCNWRTPGNVSPQKAVVRHYVDVSLETASCPDSILTFNTNHTELEGRKRPQLSLS